jgi:diguanylate cyclase (GGDEF)-like protein
MMAREKVLKVLLEISEQGGSGTRSELLERLLRHLIALADCDGAAVLIAQHRIGERTTFHREGPGPETHEVPRGVSELTRSLLRSGHPISLLDLERDPLVREDDRCPGVQAGPALFLPLRNQAHPFGTLAVYRERGRARFTSEEQQIVGLIAAWGALVLQNMRLAESLAKLAVTDDLTQVYNFRFLKTALRREIKRAGRFRQQLSLVMIDVDNLKSYNDRNGHMRGSLLLRELAGLFAKQLRSFDLVAKYGGDEFTLILPQTDPEGAAVVAERMRAAVSSHTFPLAAPGSITVSLGVATFPEDGTDPIGLIQAADRALYLAKRRGRNRVESVRELAA